MNNNDVFKNIERKQLTPEEEFLKSAKEAGFTETQCLFLLKHCKNIHYSSMPDIF